MPSSEHCMVATSRRGQTSAVRLQLRATRWRSTGSARSLSAVREPQRSTTTTTTVVAVDCASGVVVTGGRGGGVLLIEVVHHRPHVPAVAKHDQLARSASPRGQSQSALDARCAGQPLGELVAGIVAAEPVEPTAAGHEALLHASATPRAVHRAVVGQGVLVHGDATLARQRTGRPRSAVAPLRRRADVTFLPRCSGCGSLSSRWRRRWA